MDEPSQTPFDYRFDEWHPQMGYFLELEPASLDAVRDCFRLQYPDQVEAGQEVERTYVPPPLAVEVVGEEW